MRGLKRALCGLALIIGCAGAPSQESASLEEDAAESGQQSTDASAHVGAYVSVNRLGYNPYYVTVRAGDAVSWIWLDPLPSSVLSGSACVPDGMFESPLLRARRMWTMTFSNPGTYPYFMGQDCGNFGVIHVVAP